MLTSRSPNRPQPDPEAETLVDAESMYKMYYFLRNILYHVKSFSRVGVYSCMYSCITLPHCDLYGTTIPFGEEFIILHFDFQLRSRPQLQPQPARGWVEPDKSRPQSSHMLPNNPTATCSDPHVPVFFGTCPKTKTALLSKRSNTIVSKGLFWPLHQWKFHLGASTNRLLSGERMKMWENCLGPP